MSTKGDPNDQVLSPTEVMEDIVEGVQDTHPDALDTDNEGQLVIYTNIWRWKDGSYHTQQEGT